MTLEEQKAEQLAKRKDLDAFLLERDRAHKARIRKEIAEDADLGLGGDFAYQIADLIMSGKVRNVKVIY